jgi:phthiocerol/phenolphthiocerol synthesis type-I polyketide synthase E
LHCGRGEQQAASEALGGVHDALAAVPHYGIGYGLLKYVYAPTARMLAAAPAAEVFFSYLGTIPPLPELDGPVQFAMDPAAPARDTLPAFGHALELRVYRDSVGLHLDWWYDTRRLERTTVEALMQQFPAALTELTSNAAPVDDDLDSFALVDLS